jgi:ATP synthase protein I
MTNSASDGPIKALPPAEPGVDWTDEVAEPPFKALTREEAQALRARQPPLLSPWQVVAAQAAVGGAIALIWWLATGSGGKAGSALCGAAAVVLPNALMAWGIARALRGLPGAAVLGFMVWELIKIMSAAAILAAAAKWMPDLSWPALLVALIGCLKVNWLALLWRGRMKRDGH